MVRRFLFRLVVLFTALTAHSAVAGVEELKLAGQGVAVAVVDGDTLILEDGRQVRLVGVQAPKLPLGRAHVRKQPFADEAKAALEELALGRELELRQGGAPQDRHRRILAHLVASDGAWIQGEMLRRGLARVYGFPDNRALLPEMLALEREARAAGRGIWSHSFYALRAPETLEGDFDSFQIVEGTVRSAARARGKVYLNFGADWRTDFTVTLDGKAQRLFKEAGIDPLALEGRRIRVRGWVEPWDGPLIPATHPEQIEILDVEALEAGDPPS